MVGGGSGVLLIAGNLNLAASSVIGFQLGSTAGATDLIDVAGSALPAAGHDVVNITAPSVAAGTYTLLTAAAGGLTAGGTNFTLGSVPSLRGTFALNTSTTADLILTVTANPTPSAAYWSAQSPAISIGTAAAGRTQTGPPIFRAGRTPGRFRVQLQTSSSRPTMRFRVREAP